MSETSKGNFNDLSLVINGHKYTFQALTRAERDGWIVAIDNKSKDAKSAREGLVGSEGYKNQLEKYCMCPQTASCSLKYLPLGQPSQLPVPPLPARLGLSPGLRRKKKASPVNQSPLL